MGRVQGYDRGAAGYSSPEMELTAIGTVHSPLRSRAEAPKQGDEGAPEAWLAFDPRFADGLEGIGAGDEVLVLRVRPRSDAARPETGVFATRSPDRPNPIGLHRVTVLEIDGTRLRVRDLEAIDGTPILDVKPVLRSVGER